MNTGNALFCHCKKTSIFQIGQQTANASPCGGSSEYDQQLNTKLRKKIGCLSNLFASIFTTFQVFNGTFLKSVLKNKKKTKVPVRYRGTLLFFGGTGTTKVPTVPVPKKYRGTLVPRYCPPMVTTNRSSAKLSTYKT